MIFARGAISMALTSLPRLPFDNEVVLTGTAVTGRDEGARAVKGHVETSYADGVEGSLGNSNVAKKSKAKPFGVEVANNSENSGVEGNGNVAKETMTEPLGVKDMNAWMGGSVVEGNGSFAKETEATPHGVKVVNAWKDGSLERSSGTVGTGDNGFRTDSQIAVGRGIDRGLVKAGPTWMSAGEEKTQELAPLHQERTAVQKLLDTTQKMGIDLLKDATARRELEQPAWAKWEPNPLDGAQGAKMKEFLECKSELASSKVRVERAERDLEELGQKKTTLAMRNAQLLTMWVVDDTIDSTSSGSCVTLGLFISSLAFAILPAFNMNYLVQDFASVILKNGVVTRPVTRPQKTRKLAPRFMHILLLFCGFVADCHCSCTVDGYCGVGENFSNCPTDCKCGDGVCDKSLEVQENCIWCPEDCGSCIAPPNDSFCTPENLGTVTAANSRTSKRFDNYGATAQIGEPNPGVGTGLDSCTAQDGWCDDESDQNSVWYQFNVTSDVSFVDVVWNDTGCPGDYRYCPDLQFALYKTVGSCSSGSTKVAFIEVAANDNSGFYSAPEIKNAAVSAGNTYLLQVDGNQGMKYDGYAGGGGKITVRQAVPPIVPPNDSFCTPENLGTVTAANSRTSAPFTNYGATIQTGEPSPKTVAETGQDGWNIYEPDAQNSVWYQFNVTSGVSFVDVIWDHESIPFDWLQVALYKTIGSCSSLGEVGTLNFIEVAANDNFEYGDARMIINAPVSAGHTYLLQVDGLYGTEVIGGKIKVKIGSITSKPTTRAPTSPTRKPTTFKPTTRAPTSPTRKPTTAEPSFKPTTTRAPTFNPVPNDSFCTPDTLGTAMICGSLLSQRFTNVGATAQIGEPSPGAGSDGSNPCNSQNGWCSDDLQVQNSAWYQFDVMSGVSSVDIIWDHTEYPDLQFALYKTTGSCSSGSIGNLTFTQVAANDDMGNLTFPSWTNKDPVPSYAPGIENVPVSAGHTYLLQVDGWKGVTYSGGNIKVRSFCVPTSKPTTNAADLPPSWGLDRVNQCQLPLDNNPTQQNATGVKVFFIGDGMDGDHEELRDMINSDDDCHFSPPGGADPLKDDWGANTFRAGVACGRKYGVSSGCRLCSVRNSINRAWWPELEIAAIEHVVSNCKTGPPCVLHLQNLDANGVQGWEYRLVNAVNQGIVVIMSSGSSYYGQNACNFSPSFVPEIITVGAINENDGIASFGRTGPCVDFYAPGSNIRSSYYNSAYTTLNSTSAASSHVVGIAAAIRSRNPWLTPQEVRDVMMESTAEISQGIFLATVEGTCCPKKPMPVTPKPTLRPTTRMPTSKPNTPKPTTRRPTTRPTTRSPSTRRPTSTPTVTRSPTSKPSTRRPTSPTNKPTSGKPTTRSPTLKPSTRSHTFKPTLSCPTTP